MKKNMEENFEKLHERVKDAFSKTDLERIKKELEQLKGATLVSGVGVLVLYLSLQQRY